MLILSRIGRWGATWGLLCCLCGCVRSPAPITGTFDGDVYWQGRVLIDGDVVFTAGSRLVIAAGTEVVFLPPGPGRDLWTEHPNFPGSELIIKGELVAEGSPHRPIAFRFVDPTAPAGSWGGINLSQARRAHFRFCRFSQADSAVHSQESTVSVEESLFENNLVGIRFFSSRMHIENNLLRGNGTAIRFHFGAPAIRFNEITGNQRAFFFTSHPRDFIIESNNIRNSGDYAVVLGEEVPEDLSLPGNFWGSDEPSVVEATFFDGRRTAYLGSVHIVPLLKTPVPQAGISWNP